MFFPIILERVLAFSLVAISSLPVVQARPCDIYASGGTPCVAAHSTTRALYQDFKGALYKVSRSSDDTTKDILPLSNGVANAAAQDSFCAHTTCFITIIYDQSGHGNHLKQAPPGGAARGPNHNGFDHLASAIGAPVTLNGHKAYGVFSPPKTGYRNNAAKGTAKGDEPEGMYAVLDGTHYNGNCCFDYGNAETNSRDTGNGHMETIYFGSGGSSSNGKGPWILGDLENGLIGGSTRHADPPSISHRFVTALLKGKPNHWAIRGGDATSGSLSTFFRGVRPSGGYNPMKKEGAIVLGIGGDNSNRAQGTFYEGVMTSGYPTDETENKVQANIVGAKYAPASLVSGPKLTVGSSISLRATTACCTNRYIAHTGATVNTQVVSASSSRTLKQRASWKVHHGLGNSACFSFESVDTPGSYIRHSSSFELKLNANDGTKLFSEDATFCPQAGLNGKGHSLRSWNYPTLYVRHFNAVAYAASDGGPLGFDAKPWFNDDVSYVASAGFAS